jgi:hypothetical protein
LLQNARPRVQSAQRHRHLVGLRGSYMVNWILMGSQGHARRKSARARHLRGYACASGPDTARPGQFTTLTHFTIFCDPFHDSEATMTKLPAGKNRP